MFLQERYYQTEAVVSLFDYFAQSDGNPLIAMPTGTGKSVVIAKFLRRVFELFANQRIIVATHVKELIGQNAAKLKDAWPDAPIGIHSAGLKQRDYVQPIIFGGVKSIVKNVAAFGHVDLLIIDEAHLLSDNSDSEYQKIIAALRLINPKLKVIGLTATWYRAGQGLLTQGSIFTDICYNICTIEGFRRLFAEGYLVPPIPKQTATALDISSVGVVKGEYIQSQLQKAVDIPAISKAVVTEMCGMARDRACWLAFCSGVEHAEHIAEVLEQFGVSAQAVHSKLGDKERDAIIRDFKDGRFRCLTNYGIFTTGQDHPPIDYIASLRPTTRAGLWVQMVGRGMRPFEGKANCLVGDFARNTARLGTIDDPQIPKPKGASEGGEVPVKICDHCGAYNHARAAKCIDCGMPFVFEQKIVRQADTRALITQTVAPIIKTFNVSRVMYNRHVSKAKNITIKISYLCGLQTFREFVNFDATNFALHRAHEWWRQRHSDPNIPQSTDMALMRLHELRTPRRIKVHVNKDHPEVVGYEY